MSFSLSFPKKFERDVQQRWRTASPRLIADADVELTKRGWSYQGVGSESAPFVWAKTEDLNDPWSLVFEYEIAPDGGTSGPVEVHSRFSACREGVSQVLQYLDRAPHWPQVDRNPPTDRFPARLFSVSPEWLAINSSRAPLGSLFSPADDSPSTLARFMSNLSFEVDPIMERIGTLERVADFLLQVRSVRNNYGGSGYSLNDTELYAAVLLDHLGQRDKARAALFSHHQVRKSQLNRLGAAPDDFLALERTLDAYSDHFEGG